jgi:hypothetical protein
MTPAVGLLANHHSDYPKPLAKPTGEWLSLLKPVCKDYNKNLPLQIHRYKHKVTRITNNEGNVTSPEEENKAPITILMMCIYEILNT